MCGVAGLISAEDHVVYDLADTLKLLQHRAQDSAGIVVSDKGVGRERRGRGEVPIALGREGRSLLEDLPGRIGVGHIRWATAGEVSIDNVQPFLGQFRGKDFWIVHNGEISCRSDLEKRFCDYKPEITSDTKFILGLISTSEKKSFEEALFDAFSVVRGTYSLLILYRDTLFAVRDVTGNRPLAIGQRDGSYLIASESCPFGALGFMLHREVNPGEMVVFERNPLRYSVKQISNTPADVPREVRFCLFENIYLLRPDSIVWGRVVAAIRKSAGRILCQEHPVSADVVIGVPDSGVAAAVGFAEESRLPYEPMAILRAHYTGRVFISEKDRRRKNLLMKLIPISSNIRGKRVVVVDDSIIEGITIKKSIDLLRRCGAREVHVRVASPPIISPCYYGVATGRKHRRLIAEHFASQVEKIAEAVGADSLGYLSLGGKIKAVMGTPPEMGGYGGYGEENFCVACFGKDKYHIPVDIYEDPSTQPLPIES